MNSKYVLRTEVGNLSIEFEEEVVTRLKWCVENDGDLADCPDCETAIQIPDCEEGKQSKEAVRQIKEEGKQIKEAVRQIKEYLEGDRREFSFATKVRGTEFQLMVWERVRAIPYGSTATYGEIAAAIGKPGAARAVARACHDNPLVIIVPCHRVVGTGGRLTGYNGGTAIKAALLKSECELDLGLDAVVGG